MNLPKYFLCILLSTVFLTGCYGRRETSEEETTTEQNDTIRTDSITEEEDSIAESAEVAPPKKADELFDDFVFAFMKNKYFQRRRIDFPLPHKVDGDNQPIARKQWKFTPMYSNREVYTLIFDNKKAERMAKDTSIRHVIVEDFDLETRRIKCYVFQRKKSEWRLTNLNETEVNETADHNFYNFYRSFATDETFQKQHISNPLTFVTYDEDTFERIDGFISPDQWEDFAPELPTESLTNILYGKSDSGSNLRILKINSISGGMNSTLTFKRQNGQWMLVKLEN